MHLSFGPVFPFLVVYLKYTSVNTQKKLLIFAEWTNGSGWNTNENSYPLGTSMKRAVWKWDLSECGYLVLTLKRISVYIIIN